MAVQGMTQAEAPCATNLALNNLPNYPLPTFDEPDMPLCRPDKALKQDIDWSAAIYDIRKVSKSALT
jgi:hypothetical protein